MGKKTSVQFNFSSSLVWFGPTANNNGSEVFNGKPTSYKSGFNTKYGLSLNRSVGRRVSFELSADYGKTGYFNETNMGESFYSLSVYDGARSGAVDEHQLFLNAQVFDFSFAMRMFNRKKGSISPMGLYFGPRIGYTITRSEIIDRKTEYYEESDGTQINALGLYEQNRFYAVGFTTGYNRVLYDALILNLSWDFAQYLGADIYPIDYSQGNTQTSLERDNKRIQQRILRERISNQNVFLFRIGVGYLF